MGASTGFPPHLHPVHHEPEAALPRSSTRRTPGRSCSGRRLPGATVVEAGSAGEPSRSSCWRRGAGRESDLLRSAGGFRGERGAHGSEVSRRMPEPRGQGPRRPPGDRRAGRGPRRPGPPRALARGAPRAGGPRPRRDHTLLPPLHDPGEAALANGSPRPAASPSRRPSR